MIKITMKMTRLTRYRLEASLCRPSSLLAPSERPHAQREVAARRAELVALGREAECAHGARVAGERVQQRARAQVPHAHAVVGAAREEDELLHLVGLGLG